jgi:hypothetical protein
MNNLVEQEAISSPLSSRKQSRIYKLFLLLIWMIVILAFVAGLLLLMSDVFLRFLPHASLSAAPLLLIGAASLGFQALTRLKLLDFFKALIVSTAFLLWGIDQLLIPGWFATTLGDVVITLYVLDLGWMVIDRLKQKQSYP